MSQQTAQHSLHTEHAASFTDVSGLLLPQHYGSPIAEISVVRESAGMLDSQHLCFIDIQGREVHSWLRHLLCADVATLDDYQGLYSCLCTHNGGVLDYCLVFRISAEHYRFMIDVARLEKNLDWLQRHNTDGLQIVTNTDDATVAVQGPDAVQFAQRALTQMGLSPDLTSLESQHAAAFGNWFISRNGRSGEDGLYITLPSVQMTDLWQALASNEVQPIGHEAYEMLRIEAGYARYGREIDEQHTAVEAGVGDCVDLTDESREFIGKEILEDHKLFGGRSHLVGLMLDGDGDDMLARGLNVERVGRCVGKTSSGGFSPTRGGSIALAHIDKLFKGSCDVEIRGRLLAAHIVSVPFVPHGAARE